MSDEANEFAAGVEFADANAGITSGVDVGTNWMVAGVLVVVATLAGEGRG